MSRSAYFILPTCLIYLACEPQATIELSPPKISLRNILTVGRLEGSLAETFGSVGAVVPDDVGGFYVLDESRKEIKQYSSSGRLLYTVGREGRGPGEFRDPGALLVDDEGRLWVADWGNFRVSIFAADSGKPILERELGMQFPFRVFCRVGKRVFGLGYYENTVIHEIAEDGQIVNSFADPHEGPEGLSPRWRESLRRTLDLGHILCVEELGLVITLPLNLPHVRAFSADGELVWEHELRGFRRTHYTETERGTVRYEPDPETRTAHHNTGLSYVGESLLLVQVIELSLGRYVAESPVETRFVSLDSGAEVQNPSVLPVFSGRRDGRWYAYTNYPYPQVSVWEGTIAAEE